MSCPIPQRYSEVLARKGVTLIQSGFTAAGAKTLGEAYNSLPKDACLRLRLDIRHFQALAAVLTRDFDRALRHLASAKGLYETYKSVEPLGTQRFWLLGFSYLAKGQRERAEEPLLTAVKRYCALREWDGATQALAALTVLYAAEKKSEALVGLVAEYDYVFDAAASHGLALTGLHRGISMARTLGISTTLLVNMVDWLETKENAHVS
jgi:hypothetical protein